MRGESVAEVGRRCVDGGEVGEEGEKNGGLHLELAKAWRWLG